MQMKLCIVKRGVVRSIYSMSFSGRSLGGDTHMHNFPLTGIDKGIFEQVLV